MVGAIATAVVDPAGPLHRRRGEVAVVASSFGQGKIVFSDVRHFLGVMLKDREEWRVQDSQNVATIEHRETGAMVRCLGSDPRRLHGIRPLLVIADEPAQWDPGRADAAYAALRTSLGKVPGSRLIALGTRPALGGHWFSRLLRDAPYSQTHAAEKNADPFRMATWRRSNPSWDHLPSLREIIRDEAADARRDPELLQAFRALRCNMGVSDVAVSLLLDSTVWESIEGQAPRQGVPVFGADVGSTSAQSAVSAYWPESGRLESMAAFPAVPTLAERGLRDGVGNLYEQCYAAGELIVCGENAVNVSGLLAAARDRFGQPAVIWADRFKWAELLDAAKGAGIRGCRMVPRGQGFRDGAADVRAFRRACLEGKVVPVPSLLMVAALSEARTVSDASANAKLAKGVQGGRRALARDDAAAASILAVACGASMPKPSTGAFYGVA